MKLIKDFVLKNFFKRIVPTFFVYYFILCSGASYYLNNISMTISLNRISVYFKCIGVVLSFFVIGQLCEVAIYSRKYRFITLTNLLLSGMWGLSISNMIISFNSNIGVHCLVHMLNGFGFNVLFTVATVTMKFLWGKNKLINSILLTIMHLIFSIGVFVYSFFVSFIISKGYNSKTTVRIIYSVISVFLSFTSLIYFFPIDNQNFYFQKVLNNKDIDDNENINDEKGKKHKSNLFQRIKAYSIFRVLYIIFGGLFLFLLVASSLIYPQVIRVFMLSSLDDKISKKDASSLISTYYGSICLGRLLCSFKIPFLKSSTIIGSDIFFMVIVVYLLSISYFYSLNDMQLLIYTVLFGVFHSSLLGTLFLFPRRFKINTTSIETSVFVLGLLLSELLIIDSGGNLYYFLFLVLSASVCFVIQYIFGFIYEKQLNQRICNCPVYKSIIDDFSGGDIS